MKRNSASIVLFCVGLLFVSGIFQIVYAEDNDQIVLEQPQFDRGVLLMEALKHRKSTRNFSEKELPLDVLSNLLWAAGGINRTEDKLRTAPTAHNWQEIDIYVAMKKGLYLYDYLHHRLSRVLEKDIRESVGLQDFTIDAPVSLIYISDDEKMTKSDESSRRFYEATDAGFMSQNVYLFAASEGLATVVLGWINKSALAKEMQLSDTQHVILTQPVGYEG